MTDTRTITIDASGQSIGRIASRVAHVLLGKDQTDFAKNKTAPVQVVVQNMRRAVITGAKRTDKTLKRYSGYPGGLKTPSLDVVIAKKGHGEVLKKAVERMLPRNRLRTLRMKNLTINE
jgi:large subunit ribosomal protein L13